MRDLVKEKRDCGAELRPCGRPAHAGRPQHQAGQAEHWRAPPRPYVEGKAAAGPAARPRGAGRRGQLHRARKGARDIDYMDKVAHLQPPTGDDGRQAGRQARRKARNHPGGGRAGGGGAGSAGGRKRARKGGGGRRSIRRECIHRAQDNSGNVSVRTAPSRGIGVLRGRFPDRRGAGTSADGPPNHGQCDARQRDHAHEVRKTEKAAMTGGQAAAALEMFRTVLAEVRGCAAGHAGGAFPDPTMRDGANAYKERILGIAEGCGKAGFRRLGNRIRDAADGLVMCINYPGLSATTHESERGMREFVRDRCSSPVLVSPPGRRRHSDGKRRRKTWQRKGRNPVREMELILWVDPGREWAQVRAGAGAPAAAQCQPAGCRRPARMPRVYDQ